ncbi:MAG: efflux RND transporter permease subunit, partial [Nitrosomonadales bacterium]|nr:efflux RND transporter permease subunit [Nitrosomonadales bacterium]
MLISLGIPFALAGTFWILYSAGYTLNLTVLLGIIIALGMLVDDAVVMVEDIYYRMVRGEEAQSACVSAVRSVGVPVLASVLTTIAAFLPLMLLPGIVGQFMQVVPFVVTIALLVSLVEAYWMLPTHVVVIRPNFNKPSRLHGWRTRFTHGLRVKYSRLLMRIFRHPKKFFSAIVLLFVLALASIFGGLVKTQFFAAYPIRMFYVNIDMPTGTSLAATLQEVEKLEKEVAKYLKPEELRAIASYSGTKFTETDQVIGNAYGQVVVSLAPRKTGMRQPDEIVAEMRSEIEALPLKGKTSFTMLSGGPPSSKPIKLRLRGDNYDDLRGAADALRAKVSEIEGVRDLTDDDLPGRNELVLRVDEEAVKATGLTPAVIARLVRLHTDGEIAAETRSQGEKVEVRVKARTDYIVDIQDALATPVALMNGEITTLASLVKTETRVAKGIIKHYDLRRAITVEADLDKTIMDTVQANQLARKAWDGIAQDYPNVMIDYSGELDDIVESLDAMLVLFLMGVGLIYLILAAQFRSYWQPLMVISTVPMALIGVTAGLLISNNPLSLYTLYGIIALVGIAVNASIVLIDAANNRLANGMSVIHAAVYAARRRVVPVIITTTTTIGGLIWLALGVGGKSLIWGPLAAAIVWGLTISTALTLFV